MIDFQSSLFLFENPYASGLEERICIELRELAHALQQAQPNPEYLPPICILLGHCYSYLGSNVESKIKPIVSQLINVAGKTFRVYRPNPRGNYQEISTEVLGAVVLFLSFDDIELIEGVCHAIGEIIKSARPVNDDFLCDVLIQSNALEKILFSLSGDSNRDWPLLTTVQILSRTPRLAKAICNDVMILVNLLQEYSWSCKALKPLVEILYNFAESETFIQYLATHDCFLAFHPHISLALEHVPSKDGRQARNTFFAMLGHLASFSKSHCLFATSNITASLLQCASRCRVLTSTPKGPLDVELIKLFWAIIGELCEDYRNLGVILHHEILSTITPFFLHVTDRGMFQVIQESMLFTLHRLSQQVPETCLKHNVLEIIIDFLQEIKESHELCKRGMTLSIGIIYELSRFLYIDCDSHVPSTRLADNMYSLLETFIHIEDTEHIVTETLQILGILSRSMQEVELHRSVHLLIDLLNRQPRGHLAYAVFAVLKTVIMKSNAAKYFIALDGVTILLDFLYSSLNQISNQFKELTIITLRIILDLVSTHLEGREFLSTWKCGEYTTIYQMLADIWNEHLSQEIMNSIECIIPYLQEDDLELRRPSAKCSPFEDDFKVQKFLIEIEYHQTIVECTNVEKALETSQLKEITLVGIDREYHKSRHEQLIWANSHLDLDMGMLEKKKKEAETRDLMRTFEELKHIEAASKRRPKYHIRTHSSTEPKVKRLTKEEKTKIVQNSLNAEETERNILSAMEKEV